VALTRRQRNEIFEALKANGVDPQNCTLSVESSAPGLTFASIRRKPTGSTFSILDDLSGRYDVDMTVGDADQGIQPECKWGEIFSIIATWAREVRYETDTQGLWAELQEVPDVLAAAQAAEASNAPFTPDEQAEITRRLDEIKQLVRETFELTDDQLAAIDQRLDDAGEAAKHTDRKTWLYTFYGL